MAELETWHYVLIALGVCFILIAVAVVIWLKKRKVHTIKDEEHVDIPTTSPTPTTIDESDIATSAAEKGIVYGQQFATVTSAQTGLSPPRRERKPSNASQVVIHPEEESPEEHQKNIQGVFSLSPLPESESPQMTPESHYLNQSSISSNMSRTLSPFRPHTPTTIKSIWRGPTPPWTQNRQSPRQTSA